jgi:hypothetical protein
LFFRELSKNDQFEPVFNNLEAALKSSSENTDPLSKVLDYGKELAPESQGYLLFMVHAANTVKLMPSWKDFAISWFRQNPVQL